MNFSFLIIISSCGERIKGNGKVEARQQNLDHFNSIDLSGMFEVELVKGNEQIEIITDENLHEHVDIYVENDELVIDTKDKYLEAEQVLLRIYSKELNEIDVSGAISLKTEGRLHTNHFKLDVSGACEGDLDIEAESLDIEVSGAGEINALDLQAQKVHVGITGAGEIEVSAEEALDVAITGAGEVRYAGDPVVNKKISGAGEITQIR